MALVADETYRLEWVMNEKEKEKEKEGGEGEGVREEKKDSRLLVWLLSLYMFVPIVCHFVEITDFASTSARSVPS